MTRAIRPRLRPRILSAAYLAVLALAIVAGAAGARGSDTVAPSAPGTPTVLSTTTSSVTIGWTASTDNVGVMGYGTYVNGKPLVTGIHFLTYTIGGLACGTSYTLGVDAYDASGNRSARSETTTATAPCSAPAPPPPGPTPPPPAPTGLTVTNVQQTGATLSWKPAGGSTTGYTVFVNTTRVGNTRQTTTTLSGLTCGTTYSLGVEAYDAAGNRSARSTTTAATAPCSTPPPPPPAPTGLTVTDVQQTGATLSWKPAGGAAAGYVVLVNGTVVATTQQTTAPLSGLTCDTAYSLGVEAYDAAGNRSSRATIGMTTTACSGTPAPAGDLYVAANGADGSPCTATAPCATFRRAYGLAKPGQTVQVAPGSYAGQSLTFDQAKAGQSSRVTFAASGASLSSLTIDGAQHVLLTGLTVTGRLAIRANTVAKINAGTQPATDVEIRNANLREILLRNVVSVTVRDTRIGGYDVSTSGLGVPKIGAYLPDAGQPAMPSKNVLFERVVFHDIIRTQTGTTHAECLYLDGGIDGFVLRNSSFSNCGVFDVFGQPNGGDNANIVLENNLFDVPRDTTGGAAGSALNFKAGPNGIHRGLTIRFNSVLGNIRADSGTYQGVAVVGNALDNTACASVFPASAFDRNVAAVACGGTDVKAGPAFVSASRAACNLSACKPNDLRITDTSPAVDAVPTGPAVDYSGVARPIGARFDAGAVEVR